MWKHKGEINDLNLELLTEYRLQSKRGGRGSLNTNTERDVATPVKYQSILVRGYQGCSAPKRLILYSQ